MTSREITQLLVNVGQITNFTKSVNINKDAIAVHTLTLKAARTKMDKWQEIYKDEKQRKLLSPPEQQNLMKNAQALYDIQEKLVKELDFLDMSKQPLYVINAIKELEHAFLLLEWLQNDIGKNGETIIPHLACIREKTFSGGAYKNQVYSLYIELEAVGYDFYKDHVLNPKQIGYDYPLLIPICDHLITAGCWLFKEKERFLTEALPEIKKIDLPVESVLEIPEGPKDKLKN